MSVLDENQVYTPHALRETSNGNYIMVGNVILSLSRNGIVKSIYFVDGELHSIVPAGNSTFIATGYAPATFSTGILFCKINHLGQLQWKRAYRSGNGESGYCIGPADNGNFLALGSTTGSTSGNTDILMLKLNGSGDTIWTKAMGNLQNVRPSALIPTSDNNLIFTGTTAFNQGQGQENIFLVKLTQNGDTLWTKEYLSAGRDFANNILETADGGFMIVGYSIVNNITRKLDIHLIRTDSAGGIIWSKTYGGFESDGGGDIAKTADGNYVIAGFLGNAGPDRAYNCFSRNCQDALLFKIDDNGNIIWAKTYGGTKTENFYNMVATSDGGFMLSGISESFTQQHRLYAVKTDSLGNVGCYTYPTDSVRVQILPLHMRNPGFHYYKVSLSEIPVVSGYFYPPKNTSVLCLSSVSVNEWPVAKPVVSVAPNPTDHIISVSLDKSYKEIQINVLDVFGRTMDYFYFQQKQKMNFELKGPSGTYVLDIKTNEGSTVKLKVLKK